MGRPSFLDIGPMAQFFVVYSPNGRMSREIPNFLKNRQKFQPLPPPPAKNREKRGNFHKENRQKKGDTKGPPEPGGPLRD